MKSALTSFLALSFTFILSTQAKADLTINDGLEPERSDILEKNFYSLRYDEASKSSKLFAEDVRILQYRYVIDGYSKTCLRYSEEFPGKESPSSLAKKIRIEAKALRGKPRSIAVDSTTEAYGIKVEDKDKCDKILAINGDSKVNEVRFSTNIKQIINNDLKIPREVRHFYSVVLGNANGLPSPNAPSITQFFDKRLAVKENTYEPKGKKCSRYFLASFENPKQQLGELAKLATNVGSPATNLKSFGRNLYGWDFYKSDCQSQVRIRYNPKTRKIDYLERDFESLTLSATKNPKSFKLDPIEVPARILQ